MVDINNYSLAGVGPTIKLGKGGGTVGMSTNDIVITPKAGGVLKVGANNVVDTASLATYLTTNNYLTDGDIGVSVQAYSANLASYAGVTPSAFTLTLLDNADAAAYRTDLGLVIGTNVQAFDADLSAIAALAGTSGILTKTAANTWSLDTVAYAPLASPTFTGTVILPATGSGSLEAATKEYVDDAVSAVSGGGVTVASSPFAFDSSSPVEVVANLPTDAIITKITIVVTTPFNGTTPNVAVTHNSVTVDTGAGSDLTANGVYIIDSYYVAGASDAVELTISGTGMSAGAAIAYVEYSL